MKAPLNGPKVESLQLLALVIHRRIMNVTPWLLALGYVIYQL
jgi:hypothetical protein